MRIFHPLPAIVITTAITTLPSFNAWALTPIQVNAIAKDITVLIDGISPGSGTLVARNGSTYYVLTSKHVVRREDEYQIVTPDQQRYDLDYSRIRQLPDVDLAILEFTSDQCYRTAQLSSSSQLTEGLTLYAAGWPNPGNSIQQRIYQFTRGQLAGIQNNGREGYDLVYDTTTRAGMSGGPLLNEQGQVIGIHGLAEGELLFNSDLGRRIVVQSGLNLGIPIDTWLTLDNQSNELLSTNLPFTITTNPEQDIQVTLPQCWTDGLITRNDADFLAADLERGLYFMVLAEENQPLTHFSLEENSTLYRELLINGLDQHTAQQTPTNITSIARDPIAQYTVQGSIDGTDITYLHTTLNSDKKYYQILAWTYSNQYAAYESELQQIVQSFREQ